MEDLKPEKEQRGEWRARSRAALRYKKAALQIVSLKRAKIALERQAAEKRTTEHMVLNFIRNEVGQEQFVRWIADAKLRNHIVG